MKVIKRGEMKIRKNALVKFNFGELPEEYHKHYEFVRNKTFIYFGEIPNMKGHGIFIEIDSKMTISHAIIGHINNFIELSEDEI